MGTCFFARVAGLILSRERYKLDIMPFAKIRLKPKHKKTYMGSLQLWEPKDLSNLHDLQRTDRRTVQEVGSNRAQNQGISRMRPQPPLLIFMGRDDQHQSFIFRIFRTFGIPD